MIESGVIKLGEKQVSLIKIMFHTSLSHIVFILALLTYYDLKLFRVKASVRLYTVK